MDRFQYIAESDPNIAFSKTLKQEPFFSGLHRMQISCQRGINQVAPALLLYDVWKGVDLLLDNY